MKVHVMKESIEQDLVTRLITNQEELLVQARLTNGLLKDLILRIDQHPSTRSSVCKNGPSYEMTAEVMEMISTEYPDMTVREMGRLVRLIAKIVDHLFSERDKPQSSKEGVDEH